MLVGCPCGCQAGGVDASRLERSGGGGTTIVSMSGSDCGSGSLVAVVWMLAFIGVFAVYLCCKFRSRLVVVTRRL